MKKIALTLLLLFSAVANSSLFTLHSFLSSCMAQYIPAQRPGLEQKGATGHDYWQRGNTFRHLDLSVTLGTAGIGIDLATPLCTFLQLRAGYDYMPSVRKTYSSKVVVAGQTAPQYGSDGLRVATLFDRVANLVWHTYGYDMGDHIDLRGKLLMQNLRLMLDLYPFQGKNWHFTAGIYWGASRIVEVKSTPGSAETLRCINLYNALYDEASESDEIKVYGDIGFNVGRNFRLYPDNSNEISAEVKTNRLKPYVGFGYGGRLSKSRDDWKVSFDCGALFWGGSPAVITHDGTNLTADVSDMTGTVGSYMDVVKALKVYPQLSVRLTKTLF